MVRARIATFPPARHIGFAKTSQWISFQKSARCRSEADNRGALLAENLCCAATQLVGIALAFLCEPNGELRNRRCHSSLAVNDAELAPRRVKQSLKMECPDVVAACFCLHDCVAIASSVSFAQAPSPNGVRTLNPPGAIKTEGTSSGAVGIVP